MISVWIKNSFFLRSIEMNKMRHFQPTVILGSLAFFNHSTVHDEPPDAEVCAEAHWDVCVAPQSSKETEKNPHLLDIASRSPMYI